MKLVTLLILFLHYILAPLANAEIEKHVQKHHNIQKNDHVHQHGTHHHHYENNNHDDEKSTKDHVHALIDLDSTYSASSTKLLRVQTEEIYSIAFISLKLNGLKIQQAKQSRSITFYPPPDRFRNLPLII